MIGWNHLVEIERIEKLSLSIFPPPHHALLPADPLATQPNLGSRVVSTGVLQHNPLRSGHSITGHFATSSSITTAPIREFTRSAFVPKAEVYRDRRHFRNVPITEVRRRYASFFRRQRAQDVHVLRLPTWLGHQAFRQCYEPFRPLPHLSRPARLASNKRHLPVQL